jgi:hypothetical protein
MPGAEVPWAGYAGFATFLDAMRARSEEEVRVAETSEFGFITDDYGLVVEEFTGAANEFYKYKAGEWFIARSRTLPIDFMATTPDAVHGYMVRGAAGGVAEIVTPPMTGLEAGEHNHIDTGVHSHAWSGGDPQGGSVGGQTSAESPPIYAQHQEQHYHRVVTPPYFAPPQPGDMVVILWVRKQTPFVIDVVASTRLYQATIMAGQWSAVV